MRKSIFPKLLSFRDNWAIGFTPEFTVGVWVGNFDGSAMREVSGVSGAAPVLHEMFDYLHKEFGTSWYAEPASVIERMIHPLTGKLAKTFHLGLVREKFLSARLPGIESPDDYDAAGRVKLGPEYQAWFASAANEIANEVSLQPRDAGALRVVSPLPGTTYFLDPDLPESDRLPLRCNTSDRVVWESTSLKCSADSSGAFVRVRVGTHSITLRDPISGAHAETWIMVKVL